jgi:hypothetical protein
MEFNLREKCMMAIVPILYGSVAEPMVSLREHGSETSSIKEKEWRNF